MTVRIFINSQFSSEFSIYISKFIFLLKRLIEKLTVTFLCHNLDSYSHICAILSVFLHLSRIFLHNLAIQSQKNVWIATIHIFIYLVNSCVIIEKIILLAGWFYPLLTLHFKLFKLTPLQALVSSVGYTKFPCEHQRSQSDLWVCKASFGICYSASTERLITEKEGLFCTGSLTLLAVFITFHFNEP